MLSGSPLRNANAAQRPTRVVANSSFITRTLSRRCESSCRLNVRKCVRGSQNSALVAAALPLDDASLLDALPGFLIASNVHCREVLAPQAQSANDLELALGALCQAANIAEIPKRVLQAFLPRVRTDKKEHSMHKMLPERIVVHTIAFSAFSAFAVAVRPESGQEG